MASSTKRKPNWTTPERKKTRVEKEKEEEVEGFTFSRRSRRTKASGGRSQKKACESAVKRRRSSFVRGRKGRKSLQPLSSEKLGADIFKDIHEDLPPKAKIRKAFDASLQLAIEKISEQDDLSSSPNLREQAKKVLQHLRNIISDSDIVEEAFTAKEKNKQNSAPDSKVVEAAIEQDATNCQAVIERLKSEEEKWDDLLRKHQEKHDQMLKEHDAISTADQVPDFLSSEQHELLSGKPNLKGTMDKMMLLQQKAMLEVDEIAKVVQSLKKFTDASSVFVEKQVESLGIASRNIAEVVGTPKTLIRGILGRK